MTLQENPSHLPPSGNTLHKIIAWVGTTVKKTIAFLFTESNPRPDILTDAFLKTFKTEFDRMYNERRKGVHEHPEAGFFDHLAVEGCETPYSMFTAVLNDYPEIKNLRDRERSAVIAFLMKHCGLPGSSLL